MKKTISFLLALVLVLQLFAGVVPTARADSGRCGPHINWETNFLMDNMQWELLISGDGEMDDFSEGDAPWSTVFGLSKIYVSYGITSIGNYAFAGISGCYEYDLPSTVTRIGEGAFKEMSAWSINLPSELQSIGADAFYNTKLEYVTLPNTVTTIGEGAFQVSGQLKEVTLSNSLQKIPAFAFAWTALTSITIPESVTEIDDLAFYHTDLQTVYGKTGSYAETWAKKQYNITFVDPDAPAGPSGPDMPVVPEQPGNFSAVDSAEGITLSWDAPSADITEYTIHRGMSLENRVPVASVTGTTWLDTDVAEGETYSYWISAWNGDSQSGFATVSCTHGDYTAPHSCAVSAAPNPAGGKQMVSVSASAADNLSVSKIELSWSGDGEDYEALTTLTNDAASAEFRTSWSWDISGLPSGGKYVKAQAYDAAGNVSAEAVTTVTVDNTAPATPGNFRVESTVGYIALLWDESYSAPADFTCFRIYRAENGEFTLIDSIKTIGYYDYATALEAGVTYSYYITAVDTLGNESAPSAIVTGTLAEDTAAPVISDMTPRSGDTVCKQTTLQVAAQDNYLLDKAEFYYCVGGSDNWIQIGTQTADKKVNSHVFSMTWEIPDSVSGSVSLKAKVYDKSGFVTELSRLVSVLAYQLPVAPEVAVQSGFQKATLSWEYPEALSRTLRHFTVWQTDANGENAVKVCDVARTIHAACNVNLGTGEARHFVVEAVDYYGASAKSNVISVTSQPDTVAPTPVIRTGTTLTTTEEAITLYATQSTDNDALASYVWDFDGDGTPDAEGSEASHTYSEVGEYTVTLTVTDVSGNVASTTTTIQVCQVEGEDTQYGVLYVTLVNAYEEGTPRIEGADVGVLATLENGKEFRAEAITDRNGEVRLVVPAGDCTLVAAAKGFISVSQGITVETNKGNGETIALTPAGVSVTGGELTVKEMTLEEIKAAGIDTDNVDNHQVFQFETKLTFVPAPGMDGMEITPTQIVNINGDTLGWTNNWFQIPYYGITFHENEQGETEVQQTERMMDAYAFPIGEHFVLVIYGETLWLKEMFNVELLVVNNNYRYDITDCVAELELPNGLSLADMIGQPQTLVHELGTIAKKGEEGCTAKTNWYIRGDEEGSYSVSAKVSGMINGEPFVNTFSTEDLVKVYAGSALKMTVVADSVAAMGEEMRLTYYLENVTEDRSIYDLCFVLKGSEVNRNVIVQTENEYGFATKTQTYDKESFSKNNIIQVDELKPGHSVKMELFVKPSFLSIMEHIPMGPFDVRYYLKDVVQVSTERSTTNIDFEWKPRNVTHGSLSDTFGDEVGEEAVDCGIGIIDNFIGAPLAELVSGVVKFAQFTTKHRETLNDETVIEVPSIVIKLPSDAGSFFTGPIEDLPMESAEGIITVATDSDNYVIEEIDGYATMTITGDAKIFIRSGTAGETELEMTTWADLPVYQYSEDETQLVEVRYERKYVTYKVPIKVTACTHNFGDGDVCTICGESKHFARHKYNSLSLKGNIGINFYMQLSDAVAADKNTYMQFTYADGDVVKVPMSQAEERNVDGVKHYRFTATVAAKEMTDEIKAQLFYNGGSSSESTYSVAEYAEIIDTGNYDQPMKDLAQAMLRYGAYAQIHFGYHTDNPAADLTGSDMGHITAETLKDYQLTGYQGTDLVHLEGASLILKTETTMRLFFTVSEGATLSATYNGQRLSVGTRGNYTYIDLPNIAAKDLGNFFDILVHDGSNSFHVRYSPMTYCYNVLNATEGVYQQDLLNIVKALYLYNQAAVAYFNTTN